MIQSEVESRPALQNPRAVQLYFKVEKEREMQQQLNQLLFQTNKPQTSCRNAEAIKKELALFYATGKRPSMLETLYNALKSIPPSSVEAERCFSAAGLFVTKIRTSLRDDTLDTLCFLRAALKKM